MPLRSEPQALKAEWRVNAFLEQVGNRASRSFALNAIFWLSIAELRFWQNTVGDLLL